MPKEDTRTEFGRVIDIRLAVLNMKPTDLIREVKARTGKYFDSSYLYRIRHGRAHSKVVEGAIRDILGIEI